MAYLQRAAALGNPSLGTPTPPPGPGSLSTPPPVPSTEPPPYDVAADPSWMPFVQSGDHAWRSFLNEISPEHRQMLHQRLTHQRSLPPGITPIPNATPEEIQRFSGMRPIPNATPQDIAGSRIAPLPNATLPPGVTLESLLSKPPQ